MTTKAKSETPKEIIEEYHKWLKDLPPNAKRLLKKYQEKILEKRSCSDYEQGKKDTWKEVSNMFKGVEYTPCVVCDIKKRAKKELGR